MTGGKAARNERRKITATAFNNLAVAFVVTGAIVPLVSYFYEMVAPKTTYWPVFVVLWV